ncbi:MAG: GDSL-type esterase/lipase family protein [Oscillospiraceae bacterium]
MKKIKAFIAGILAFSMLGIAAAATGEEYESITENEFGDAFETSSEAETPDEPAELSGIAFIGDSICKMGQWNSLFERSDIDNYGVGGYTSSQVLEKFKNDVEKKYEKLFILCGINDWRLDGFGTTFEQTLANFREMIAIANTEMKGCEIYIIGLLPTSGQYESFITENQSPALNGLLKELCGEYENVTFIDCWDALLDPETGYGDTALSDDGLHPNEDGFAKIAPIIRYYIDGTAPAEYEKGDANMDGTVDVLDLVMIRAHIVGNEALSGEAAELADLDGNGEISILDVVMLRSQIVNA